MRPRLISRGIVATLTMQRYPELCFNEAPADQPGNLHRGLSPLIAIIVLQ